MRVPCLVTNTTLGMTVDMAVVIADLFSFNLHNPVDWNFHMFLHATWSGLRSSCNSIMLQLISG